MRLPTIFIIFLLTEYIVRTFVDAYKYHAVGLFLEFLPLIIATIVSGFIFKTSITTRYFGRTYLKLISVSFAGLLTAKTILFIQWYWFIAPEYRKVPGDMTAGLGFTMVFLTLGTFIMLLLYLILMLTFKYLNKERTVL